jgi:hypothetical protein
MLSLARKGQPGRLRTQGEPPTNVQRIIVGALLSGSVALAGLGLSMGTAQAIRPGASAQPKRLSFDPQPDPPGKVAPSHQLDPGEIHGFNPQPDPPVLPASVAQRG